MPRASGKVSLYDSIQMVSLRSNVARLLRGLTYSQIRKDYVKQIATVIIRFATVGWFVLPIKLLRDKKQLGRFFRADRVFPWLLNHLLVHQKTGTFPDLRHPRTLNDWVALQIVKSRGQVFVDCADKVLARKRASELDPGISLAAQILWPFPPALCVEDDFILKTNHWSGNIQVPSNYSHLESTLARRFQVYGVLNGEWPYSRIVPKVFLEQRIRHCDLAFPTDYKFFCVKGEVVGVQVLNGRFEDLHEILVDPQGISLPLYVKTPYSPHWQKPPNWNDLVDSARKLSAPFDFVRLDLFSDHEHVFFGEFTFFPYAGALRSPGNIYLGRKLTARSQEVDEF
jgi:hypothetical protein